MASMAVFVPGAPPVRARFWSYILKVSVTDRKRQMVMEEETIGIMILRSVCP